MKSWGPDLHVSVLGPDQVLVYAQTYHASQVVEDCGNQRLMSVDQLAVLLRALVRPCAEDIAANLVRQFEANAATTSADTHQSSEPVTVSKPEAEAKAKVTRKPDMDETPRAETPRAPNSVDLIAELIGEDDFALVRAKSGAGWEWTNSQPLPWVIEGDWCDRPVIVETHELENAEAKGLVVWRVYSSSPR